MPDIVSPEIRSRMMSGIRGQNTKPEIRIRKLLHAAGFRFRVHVKVLPGKPDIVLPRYHAVVFVDGCFWHGHNCELFRWPKTRQDWWKAKIETTKATDARNMNELNALGYKICHIWECALKGRSQIPDEAIIGELGSWLREETDRTLIIRGA